MPDVSTALAWLSDVVSIGSFLKSAGLDVSISTIREYFKRENKKPVKDFDAAEAVPFIRMLVIDPTLLKVLTEIIERAQHSYAECLKRAATRQGKFACDRRAEHDICDSLMRIKERNRGELPTPYLQRLWDSYGCVD